MSVQFEFIREISKLTYAVLGEFVEQGSASRCHQAECAKEIAEGGEEAREEMNVALGVEGEDDTGLNRKHSYSLLTLILCV